MQVEGLGNEGMRMIHPSIVVQKLLLGGVHGFLLLVIATMVTVWIQTVMKYVTTSKVHRQLSTMWLSHLHIQVLQILGGH